jgi:alpha-mannosidase
MSRWFPAAAAVFFLTLGHAQAQTPDLGKQPTLFVVGYAHLDTEWRWEYPQVIDEYILRTMRDNFALFEKYPHYIFNFSGANRYRFMKEYYPADFAKVKHYVDSGRWFPAGSSMEEGDVNAPSAEAIIRQILYGNDWFRKELGKASAEYMLPDCFGFPASLPSILAHAGVKGFSTQKLTWGSSADAGGPESIEQTPEGTPFNVGVWVGPDGRSVIAALNPGSYSADITTDLSTPLPPAPAVAKPENPQWARALAAAEKKQAFDRYQGDWAARVENNGKATGVYTDYHYFGTGDIGGSPREPAVKLLEAIVTKGVGLLPPPDARREPAKATDGDKEVQVGEGPVHVVSSEADRMFLDITPAEAAGLPHYTGEMELTNHSAGSLTSQAYQKRWIRKEEILGDAAEKASIAAAWLGARKYPMDRLNSAWTLTMGGHFHDIAAGTATPKSYEYAWNDDVVAMNTFSSVLTDATQAVAASLNTEGSGVPVVVYNTLNIPREDVVEAALEFPGGMPAAVTVTGPDGRTVPSQISGGKVLFLAKAPSVGYAVYHVAPASAAAAAGEFNATGKSLENARYRVTLNDNGDIASIFDKSLHKELLSAPARLDISYDNPTQWPAWNMDWDQEQAKPRAYVGGPAKIRVVENGPVRYAVEITRETEGSKFVQTVRLATGGAGDRVEIANVVDWNTRESNLKAEFPLTASNQMATYNWNIGTIERPTAQPKKFEVPSHQWIDLTDASDAFGATILTDCKNGSDKPRDNVIRLTLIRTPGTRGGYPDQGTQDLGHHEFVYGIAGHGGDWRHGETDWQGYRLNEPLMAFETAKHQGTLGREFSLLRINNPRVRVMAMKKAELSDEVILRMVEMDGKPARDVRVTFPSPVVGLREVNGQEQPLGGSPAGASVGTGGELVTSFTAYQPRTFAFRLTSGGSRDRVPQSRPVALTYDLAAASNDGTHSAPGFDAQGDALPAEMLPAAIDYGAVHFQLAASQTGTADAVVAKGQTIPLPGGHFNRLYILAAAADGDQKATFRVGEKPVELTVENWTGYVGQWDNRIWHPGEVTVRGQKRMDPYAEMVRIEPGYIKRAPIAWFASHHHNADGANQAYQYSYLFAYAIDVPANARTLTLPDNDKIRVMAVSVAEGNPDLQPAEELYN